MDYTPVTIERKLGNGGIGIVQGYPLFDPTVNITQ